MTRSNENPSAVDRDADGLPLPTEEFIAKWRPRALASAPNPEDWADAIVFMLWQVKLEREGVKNPQLPEQMTAIERCLFILLSCLRKSHLAMEEMALAPLQRLHAAIVDLADGRVSPIFKPTKGRAGNPGKGVTHSYIQGMAARTLDLLIEAGEDVHESAKRVAAALRKGRRDMRDISADTVENWRERLRRGHVPGAPDEALRMFNDRFDDLGASAKEKAETLLKSLEKRSSAI